MALHDCLSNTVIAGITLARLLARSRTQCKSQVVDGRATWMDGCVIALHLGEGIPNTMKKMLPDPHGDLDVMEGICMHSCL